MLNNKTNAWTPRRYNDMTPAERDAAREGFEAGRQYEASLQLKLSDLLIKYIGHVTKCEGVNFIDEIDTADNVFTAEELKVLQALETGQYDDFPNPRRDPEAAVFEGPCCFGDSCPRAGTDHTHKFILTRE